MRVIDMQSFVTLARLRNFRRAAEAMNITQPAISGRLAALEEQYDARLIERGSGTFRLTGAGETVLAGFERALVELDAVAEQLSGMTNRQPGLLRIGAIDTVAATWMPTLIERLHTVFPGLQIELTVDGTDSLLRGLRDGQFEIVFAIQPVVHEDFRNFSPCHFQMVWVGSPQLIDPDMLYTPQDIARLPIISFPKASPPFLMIAPYFHDEQALASKLTFCNSLYAIVNLLIESFGVAALPTLAIRQELAAGRLCLLKAAKPFPSMPIVASYPARGDQTLLHLVMDTLREVIHEYLQRNAMNMMWAVD